MRHGQLRAGQALPRQPVVLASGKAEGRDRARSEVPGQSPPRNHLPNSLRQRRRPRKGGLFVFRVAPKRKSGDLMYTGLIRANAVKDALVRDGVPPSDHVIARAKASAGANRRQTVRERRTAELR